MIEPLAYHYFWWTLYRLSNIFSNNNNNNNTEVRIYIHDSFVVVANNQFLTSNISVINWGDQLWSKQCSLNALNTLLFQKRNCFKLYKIWIWIITNNTWNMPTSGLLDG